MATAWRMYMSFDPRNYIDCKNHNNGIWCDTYSNDGLLKQTLFCWWVTESNTLLLIDYLIKHYSIDGLFKHSSIDWIESNAPLLVDY